MRKTILLLMLFITAVAAGERPNIVFILCDDLGYGDLGCYGQKKLKTPNIDRLAREGMLFTDHYSGSTVCAPSRSVLMTGQHTGMTPVRGNSFVRKLPDGTSPRELPDGTYTIATLLQNAGYYTGMFGKWGLGYPNKKGDPLKLGFNDFYGYYSQGYAHTYYPNYLWENTKKINLDGNTYSHDLIWNKGMAFIRKQAKSKKPFFCYYPITVPHASMSAPEELHEKWRKIYPQFEKAARYSSRGKDRTVQNPTAGFAAMMENLDNQVGALLDELKTLGIDKNTLVIFTSDNGAHREGGHNWKFWDSNGPLRGLKRDLTEGGIRTPMLMRWPAAIKAGSRTDHPSAFWDFLPTFAAMVGQEVPASVQTNGISMLPTMSGNAAAQKKHKALYWEFNEKGAKQAVRHGKWKAIRYLNNETGEHKVVLYDLSNDIGEGTNLANKFPEVLSRCLELMKAERTESPYFPIGNYKK
jgi:arylsulfatase A-like enzyme